MEEWKDIMGAAGYQISSLGRVKSFKNCRGKGREVILTPRMGTHGYWAIILQAEPKKTRTAIIARFVAEAFIPNPEGKRCVNHINGIKTDDRLENLEWVTHSENILHAYRTGLKQRLKGEAAGRAILNESQVLQIRKLRSEEPTPSYAKLGEMFGVACSTIRAIISRKSWAHI